MGVCIGAAPAFERSCCIVVPWIGFAILSAVFVWQHTTQPQWLLTQSWQPGAHAVRFIRTEDVSATSRDQLDAAQQRHTETAGAKQVADVSSEDAASNETWPVSRHLQCGASWQLDYAARHAAMLRGDVPPRFLVVQGMNGLADSMVGAVSMLYVALLQGRSFFMTFGGPQQYEWAFSAPHINWTWDPQLGEAHNSTDMVLTSKPRARLVKMLQHMALEDVRQLEEHFVTLNVRSMAGFSMKLLDNPHHKDELWRLGVRPATAFACGIDFLLRIRPQALAMHSAAHKALSDNSVLKIGIQIRAGDNVLIRRQHDNTSLAQYDAFFDCASQLEAGRRATPEQRVIYYLISDSVRLRQLAAAALGPKLVTSLDAPVQHSRMQRDLPEAELRRGFEAAAAEMWLFSLTNYQVITLHSGFGRLGAFMSGRYHQVYYIDVLQNQRTPPPRRSCTAYDYASIEYIGPNSTGLGAPGL